MNITKIKLNAKINTKEDLEKHPVAVLGVDYKVKIQYKNIRIAELDVEKKTIKISLPNKYKKASDKKILDFAIEKMYEQIAKVEIERAMEKTRILLGFAPDDYLIETLNNKLGNCVERKIIIDPNIVKFHRDIIDYVVLHEYCHLKYKTHAKSFIELLKKYEPKYKEYDNQIKDLGLTI